MQRRQFISLGTAPVLGAMLSACGGSDETEAIGPFKPGLGVTIEPGVDAGSLSSVPGRITIDLAYLQEALDGQIRSSVVIGTTPQIGVPVTFYDAAGHILGSAVTDAYGMAETELPARRLVVAEAQTASGTLRGMRFYSGAELLPTLYVDVLQTVFVEVIVAMLDRYNVSMYVLQDYFRIPHGLNLFNIGHEEPLLDQRLVCQAWQRSGQLLPQYVQALSADIVDHVDDDAHVNLQFNAYLQSAGLSKQLPIKPIVELAGGIAIDLLSKAIPFPYASNLLKFAFGQFTAAIFPGQKQADPFIEVRQYLQAIETRLEHLDGLIKKSNWETARKDIAKNFSVFVNVIKDLEKVQKEHDKSPLSEASSKAYRDYKAGLLALTQHREAENGMRVAVRQLLGQEEFQNIGAIDSLLAVIKDRKFYSKTAEDYYRFYLAYFLSYQALGYMLLSASYVLRANLAATNVDPATQEQEARENLQDMLEEISQVAEYIKAVDVKGLPERINIDTKNNLVWLGSCGLVKNLREFWPTNSYACEAVNRFNQCTDSQPGQGLNDWKGPKPEQQMRRVDALVSEAAWRFGAWRSPSYEELKVSFYDDAKYKSQKVDVYATENGFSCFSEAKGLELKAFSNFLMPPGDAYRVELAQIPSQYHSAGKPYDYLACTLVDLRNSAVTSGVSVRSVYIDNGYPPDHSSRFVFFPTFTVSQALLEQHLPWLRVAASRNKL